MAQPSSRAPLGESEVTLSGVINLPPEAGHLPLTSALQLALRAARVVAQVHDRGQTVGVLDAAHLICAADGAMSIGGKGGAPLAPEIEWGGAPGKLTDVYGLGALLYRLLTGRRFVPSRLIEPPSHVNPAVDSSLDELVLAALDDDPAQRPRSARDFERQLVRICEELGLEDTHSEADRLIARRVSAAPQLEPAPVPAPAPRQAPVVAKPTAAARPAPRRRVTPEVDDDDDDFDFRPVSSGLFDGVDRKWLIGGAAALVALLFLVWPSDKKPPKASHRAAEITRPVEPPPKKVQAFLVEPQPAAAQPKLKLAAQSSSRPARHHPARPLAQAKRSSDDTGADADDNPVLPPDERERAAGQAERALQESD